MATIAVLEWIRGGGHAACPDDELPPSLLSEGTAMLSSLVGLLAGRGHSLSCCVDARWGTSDLSQRSDVHFCEVHQPSHQQTQHGRTCPPEWLSVALSCERTVVVAPEIGGVLERLLDELRQQGVEPINCRPPFLLAASDKWDCYQHWEQAGICTPPTALLAAVDDGWMHSAANSLNSAFAGEWIIKPRDGAGSEDLSIVPAASARELFARFWNSATAAVDNASLPERFEERFIVQPRIRGGAFSRCVVVDRGGHRRWLPLMTQELSADLKYLGGRFAAADGRHSESSQSCEDWEELATAVGTAMGGELLAGELLGGAVALNTPPARDRTGGRNVQADALSDAWCDALLDALGAGAVGWVGLDLLLGVDGSWYAIECNPRCTTSIVHLLAR